MIRAIRIRLYPTPDQKKYLAGLFGAVRFCFNKALYLKTHFYKVKGVNLHPIHDLKKLIAIAKNTKKYAWLAEYDCMALQESVRNLNKPIAASSRRKPDIRASSPDAANSPATIAPAFRQATTSSRCRR